MSWGQILIDPNGDGGFENGNSFAANGWYEAQPGNNRQWRVGIAPGTQGGSNAAYIGGSSNYNGTNFQSVQHFYRDVNIPSGASNITFSFYLKMPTVDAHPSTPFLYDFLKVFTTASTNTPVSGIVPSSGYNLIYGYEKPALTNYTLQSITLPNSLAGTTVRLVFTFKSDGANPNANPAIDNISLTYTPANDAGISAIASLTCPGTQNVMATIKNYGTTNLTSATINWSVNGVAQTPYSWTGNLAKDATANVSLGNYNFAVGTDYIITATTSLPNGVVDGYSSNDGFTTAPLQASAGPDDVNVTNNDALICKNSVQTLKALGGDINGIKYTLNSGTLNKTIPDNSATGTFHNFLVSGIPSNAIISRVDVKFNINHTWIEDVEVNLQAPNGKIVNLVGDRGSSGDNFTNTIATSSTTAVSFSSGSAPFTGTFKADLLAQTDLIGTINTRDFSDLFSVANGTWKLLVYDDFSSDVGTLVNCEITITYSLPAAITWTASPSLPNTIFTDLACTTPYVAGTYANTVYVKPTGNVTYTAVSSNGTCSKSDTVSFTTETAVWNGSSWSPTPSVNRAIDFQGNYTSSGANLQACSCTVTSGNIIISSGDKLTLQDELNVAAGTLTFENNSNLIQTNKDAVNSGNVIFKRNAKMKRLEYTFWSAPVSGQNLKLFSSGTLDNRFYVYNETNDYFDGVFAYSSYSGFNAANAFPLQNKSTYNFELAKGYVIRAPNTYGSSLTSQDWVFTGVPNNGTKTINISKSTTGNGFNLIGNPYPSNISFKDFYAANSSIIANKALLWTNTNINPPVQQGASYSGNNYATITSTGGLPAVNSSIIPTDEIVVGQGFLVQKLSNGTSPLVFDNTMRRTTPGVFFNARMTNTGESPKFWLKLTTPVQNYNTLLVGYVDGATNGFDEQFDAEPMARTSDMFYSVQDNKNLIIQGRDASFSIQDSVPLGAVFFDSGNYEISIAKLEGIFNNGQAIYLKDNVLGKTVNLAQGAYSFYATAGETNNRFEIVYQPESTLSTTNTNKKEWVVYQNNEMFIIDSPEIIKKVIVSDASGRMVYQTSANSKSAQINASQLAKGLYYITVENQNIKSAKKIMKK